MRRSGRLSDRGTHLGLPTGLSEEATIFEAPSASTTRVDARPRPGSGPADVLGSVWRHRALVWQLARREVLSRYSASSFGLFWAVLQPLVLLALYTFVFGVVFEARWGLPS